MGIMRDSPNSLDDEYFMGNPWEIHGKSIGNSWMIWGYPHDLGTLHFSAKISCFEAMFKKKKDEDRPSSGVSTETNLLKFRRS